MSSLLDPRMQLLDSFENLDDAAYEEETTEYIVLDFGASPIPETIEILVSPLLARNCPLAHSIHAAGHHRI